MYKWDIRPNTDLQESSAMYNVIDLLYQSHDRGCVALKADYCFDLAQLRWLRRQRQVSIYFDSSACCHIPIVFN